MSKPLPPKSSPWTGAPRLSSPDRAKTPGEKRAAHQYNRFFSPKPPAKPATRPS